MDNYIVPLEVKNNLHISIVNQVEQLTPNSKRNFVEYFKDKRKSVGLAYVFGILLGAHYAYVGKWGIQFLFWLSVLFYVGLIWWVIDWFRIPAIVKNYNDNLAVDILNRHRLN